MSIEDLRAANKLHLLVEWASVLSRFEDARLEAEQLAASTGGGTDDNHPVVYFIRNLDSIKGLFVDVSKNKEGRFAPVGALYNTLAQHGASHGYAYIAAVVAAVGAVAVAAVGAVLSALALLAPLLLLLLLK